MRSTWLTLMVAVTACGEVGAGGRAVATMAMSLDAGAWSPPVNLGEPFSSPGQEITPALTPDGLALYFSSSRLPGFGANDLWVARRASTRSPWGPAVNLGPIVNSGFGDSNPCFTPDGLTMFFNSNRPGVGSQDIYRTTRLDASDDLGWGPPVLLGPEVNTAAFEAGPWFAGDGHDDEDGEAGGDEEGEPATLYFNRGPSNAAQDIYSAPVTPDGSQVLAPATAVAELNAEGFSTQRVTVRTDQRELYLTSNRPSAGIGFEIFVSTRRHRREPWGAPAHLAIFSTPRNDIHPNLSRDGRTLYFVTAVNGTPAHDEIFVSTRRPGRHAWEEPQPAD